jgi:phosphoglycerate dehydrogenase-like enzyme
MQMKGIEGPHLQILQQGGFEIVTPPAPWDHQLEEEEMFQVLPGIDATLAGSEPYTERVLAAHPQLKVIARLGVGYDAVDVPAATRHGVVLTITCGANHDTVAEHAFSLLLALAKYVTVTDRQMRQGLWIRDVTIPIRGRVMGIVGLGRIGQAMALRSLAFGMKVIASDVQPNADFVRKHGIEVVELPELLKRSDVVSLHAPMGSATKHLINKQTLALMKPTAFLINTARGGLIDEEALVEALQKRKIAGAGLDVFAQEPPPTNHAFFKLDNVVMTPHLGGTDVQSRLDMAELAARSVVELASGRWPEALIVNHDVKSKFRWLKAN